MRPSVGNQSSVTIERRTAMHRKGSDPHLNDQELYEDLRQQGDSKEKAARISNAAASRQPRTQEREQEGRRGSRVRGPDRP